MSRPDFTGHDLTVSERPILYSRLRNHETPRGSTTPTAQGKALYRVHPIFYLRTGPLYCSCFIISHNCYPIQIDHLQPKPLCRFVMIHKCRTVTKPNYLTGSHPLNQLALPPGNPQSSKLSDRNINILKSLCPVVQEPLTTIIRYPQIQK